MLNSKIVNEYDHEITQSQTADNPVAPRGRAAQPTYEEKMGVPRPGGCSFNYKNGHTGYSCYLA